MTCKECGANLGFLDLSCRSCAMRRSHEVAMDRQRNYLAAVLANKEDVTLMRYGRHPYHIRLAGTMDRTFCWKETNHLKRLVRLPWYEAEQLSLCSDCLHVFRKIAEEVPAA